MHIHDQIHSFPHLPISTILKVQRTCAFNKVIGKTTPDSFDHCTHLGIFNSSSEVFRDAIPAAESARAGQHCSGTPQLLIQTLRAAQKLRHVEKICFVVNGFLSTSWIHSSLSPICASRKDMLKGNVYFVRVDFGCVPQAFFVLHSKKRRMCFHQVRWLYG